MTNRGDLRESVLALVGDQDADVDGAVSEQLHEPIPPFRSGAQVRLPGSGKRRVTRTAAIATRE